MTFWSRTPPPRDEVHQKRKWRAGLSCSKLIMLNTGRCDEGGVSTWGRTTCSSSELVPEFVWSSDEETAQTTRPHLRQRHIGGGSVPRVRTSCGGSTMIVLPPELVLTRQYARECASSEDELRWKYDRHIYKAIST